MIAGHKQNDKFRRAFDLIPIGFRAQRLYVFAHLPRMLFKCILSCRFIGGLCRIEIGSKRNLAINNDATLAGQMNDEVGAQHAVFI